MAKMTIDEHGATITLENGVVVPCLRTTYGPPWGPGRSPS